MSLAEMAARAASVGPLTCPRCGCRDIRTDKKEEEKGRVLAYRYKECRHCKLRLYTAQEPEVLIRIVGPEANDNFGGSVV